MDESQKVPSEWEIEFYSIYLFPSFKEARERCTPRYQEPIRVETPNGDRWVIFGPSDWGEEGEKRDYTCTARDGFGLVVVSIPLKTSG